MSPGEVVVVDSSVWIDLLSARRNGHTLWLQERLDRDGIALTDVILCEILRGFRTDHGSEEALNDLSEFQMYDTSGRELAIQSARNYRLLRKRGATVRTAIDCLIATFCIQNGFFLLHRDRDFIPFEKHLGLHVIRPARPRVQ